MAVLSYAVYLFRFIIIHCYICHLVWVRFLWPAMWRKVVGSDCWLLICLGVKSRNTLTSQAAFPPLSSSVRFCAPFVVEPRDYKEMWNAVIFQEPTGRAVVWKGHPLHPTSSLGGLLCIPAPQPHSGTLIGPWTAPHCHYPGQSASQHGAWSHVQMRGDWSRYQGAPQEQLREVLALIPVHLHGSFESCFWTLTASAGYGNFFPVQNPFNNVSWGSMMSWVLGR